MKKIIAFFLILAMLFSFTACSKINLKKNTLSVCLENEPDTIDPALCTTINDATLLTHLYAGLAKWDKNEQGEFVVVPDIVKELTEGKLNDDGTVTYTYILKDNIKWSDNKPLTASDFVFAWNRAASPELASKNSYMFDVIVGYDEMWEKDEFGKYVNNNAKLAVKAIDNSTLNVTLKYNYCNWNEVLTLPAFFPVREDASSFEAYKTDTDSYVSNGAYKLELWEDDSLISLSKNNAYHNSADVTVHELKFHFSDNTYDIMSRFENNDWLFIDNIPLNELDSLKENYQEELKISEEFGTFYLCWNINKNILPEDSGLNGNDAEKAMSEIRNAISLLIDRNYILTPNVKAASSFIPPGFSNPDGSKFYKTACTDRAYDGYYNTTDSEEAFAANYTAAISTLRKYYSFNEEDGKFTDVPALKYICCENSVHQNVGEHIKGALAVLGIEIILIKKDDSAFLETRNDGEYDIACNNWCADYHSPLAFLEIYTTHSGYNDIRFGRENHKNLAIYNLDLTPYGIDIDINNGTWSETYDVLVYEIKSTDNNQMRYELMHLAEDMLMQTGCIMPISYFADIFMINSNLDGVYYTASGCKYFGQCTFAQ